MQSVLVVVPAYAVDCCLQQRKIRRRRTLHEPNPETCGRVHGACPSCVTRYQRQIVLTVYAKRRRLTWLFVGGFRSPMPCQLEQREGCSGDRDADFRCEQLHGARTRTFDLRATVTMDEVA